MTDVRSGGCLCGRVRYESAGEPLYSLLCHCRDCQHQSGGAYVAAMRVPAAGFRITKGEPRLYVSLSDAGNEVTRAFCGECGCPLVYPGVGAAGHRRLRVGSLDDAERVPPRGRHLCQKCAALGPHEPRPAKAPDLSAWPRLHLGGVRAVRYAVYHEVEMRLEEAFEVERVALGEQQLP